MARATYTEIECKSALNRVTNMGFGWSLNPYKGCVHACAYCYARANHGYLGLNAGTDFESKLFVKTNIVEVLRRELSRRNWKQDEVAIGTSTDPYQPIEGRYRLTGGIISALADHATPAHIVTKSPLVVRDIEELARLNERAGVRVCFTITTLDREVWRVMEPGTAPPAQRLRALKRLSEAGVPSGIFLAPVMPRITDSEAALRKILEGALEAGAEFCWTSPLRLVPPVRDHYFETIERSYPHLLDRYQRNYRTPDAPREYRAFIMERLDRLRAEYGLSSEGARPTPPPRPQQLSLLGTSSQ